MGISDTCKTTYRAAHDSGPRNTSDIKYVVIHATESSNAKGSASWFENQASGGSANLVVDDKECYKTVPDDVTPWGAPPLNQSGFHIEQAGYSGWSRANWLLHLNTIKRCAYKTAQRCKAHKIPLVFLSVADLKAGKKGITSHNNVSLAYGQSNHTDPGKNYPYGTFMWLVKRYYKSL